jgi:hypothetical protein
LVIKLDEFFSKRQTKEELSNLEKDKESLIKVKNNVENIKFLQKIDSSIIFNMKNCLVAFQPTLTKVNAFFYDPIKFYKAAAEKIPDL